MVTNNNEKKSEGRHIPFMDDEKYFTERLEGQIDYYDRKASASKVKYHYYKRLEFGLAASIPVVIGLSAMGISEGSILFSITSNVGGTHDIHFTLAIILQICAALAGVILAFINKIIELDDYYKTWKDFRVTHELLYNQKILYLTKTAPYDDDETSFSMFVQSIENILSKEVQKWSIVKQDDNKLTKNAQASIDNMFKKFEDGTSGQLVTTKVEEEATVTAPVAETLFDNSFTPIVKKKEKKQEVVIEEQVAVVEEQIETIVNTEEIVEEQVEVIENTTEVIVENTEPIVETTTDDEACG